MKLITKFIALILALIATFSAGAADNGGDPMVNQRLVQLLKKLESAKSETYLPVPLAAIPVGGTFRFALTVNRVSTNAEPMACEGNVSHFTPAGLFYSESAGGRVIFPVGSNTGTCIISIPYVWKKADPLLKVSISASILPYFPCSTTCVERPIRRISIHDIGDIALPANGALTNITDSFRL